jgi:hypothetical protein
MSDANGEHILLRKIHNTRQQINILLDGLELDVKQYIDNQQPTGGSVPSTSAPRGIGNDQTVTTSEQYEARLASLEKRFVTELASLEKKFETKLASLEKRSETTATAPSPAEGRTPGRNAWQNEGRNSPRSTPALGRPPIGTVVGSGWVSGHSSNGEPLIEGVNFNNS